MRSLPVYPNFVHSLWCGAKAVKIRLLCKVVLGCLAHMTFLKGQYCAHLLARFLGANIVFSGCFQAAAAVPPSAEDSERGTGQLIEVLVSVMNVVLICVFLVSLQPELQLLPEFSPEHSKFPVCPLPHQTSDSLYGKIKKSFSEQ